MFSIDLEVFILIYVAIGLVFILTLWLYYDRRDIKLYEMKRNSVVFHCIKCGQLYTTLKGNEIAGCPACSFKNPRLKF